MNPVLKLVFVNGEGKRVTLTVNNPKENMDSAVVRDAMDKIVKSKSFTDKHGTEKFVKVLSARYYAANTIEVFNDKAAE